MKTKVKMYCLIDKTDGRIVKLADRENRYIVGFLHKKDMKSFVDIEYGGPEEDEAIKKIEFEVEL